MLKTRTMALAAALLFSTGIVAPAQAAETIAVPFTTPSVGTTGLYSGIVRVTVSGTGFSRGSDINDAFYFSPSGAIEPSGYYQLGFGTAPLQPFTPGNAAFTKVVGGRPAFNVSGVYTFLLNTGATTPTNLFFGVTDGQYGDNGGAFSINVAGVPEPATWGLMILGFGAVGGAMRRRKVATSVRFA